MATGAAVHEPRAEWGLLAVLEGEICQGVGGEPVAEREHKSELLRLL